MSGLAVDFKDPQTFWLNVTNLALGAVCAACIVALLGGVAHELYVRLRHRVAHSALAVDDHMFRVPGLGATMADGGRREQARKGDKHPKERR